MDAREKPWGVSPSATPLKMHGSVHGEWLVITLTDGSSCRVNSRTGQVELRSGSRVPYEAVMPRTLTLHQWIQPSAPALQLHSFALPHMLSTGQAPRPILVEAAAKCQSGVTSVSILLNAGDTFCVLHRMLGVSVLQLTFSSIYNVGIYAKG